jgi:hypothetical protein
MEIPHLTLDCLISFVTEQHPDGDPLACLAGAVLVSAHVSEQADNLIGHFVDQARRSGATWSQIGSSMGVTKQAAQKKFVPRWGDDLASGGRTFARWTDFSRNVVVAANRLANGAGLDEIAPEHLVLGLFSEPEGFAAKILTGMGVTEQRLSEEFGHTTDPADFLDSMPFAADTAVALESAVKEAMRLGHNYVGTEHLLLGVIAVPSIDVTGVLATMGVTTETIEPKVLSALEFFLAGRNRQP